jgi:hypothetical protein
MSSAGGTVLASGSPSQPPTWKFGRRLYGLLKPSAYQEVVLGFRSQTLMPS